MRLFIIITVAVIFLYTTEATGRKKITNTKKILDSKSSQNVTESTKVLEKITYPKKAISLKKRPTKTTQLYTTNSTLASTDEQKDVVNVFKNLPDDDLDFIKELDRQFKLHGSKLKIKIQRENTTNTKNSKRTIEGDLGYGYAHNGYTYERPKFMFYPYSQKDIPSDAPSYYPQYETQSVTIEPSYSNELKPQTYLVTHDDPTAQIDLPQVSHAEQPHSQPEQVSHQENYQEPVIVLRIPGPTKYATHLQSLLQQYLELRAAQYLRILQETESRKQQQESQHLHEQYANQVHSYEQQLPAQHVEPPSPHYYAETEYAQQLAPTPQPVMYPAIDEVYHNYKQHYQQQQNYQQNNQPQHTSAQIYDDHQSHVSQSVELPQYYYTSDQESHQPQSNAGYQQVYLISMGPAYSNEEQYYSPPQQPIYVQEEEQHHADHHLVTSENNPRPTHTKILFTQNSEGGASDPSIMYPLPSIRPFDRHAPTSNPDYHQEYQQSQTVADLDLQQSAPAESSPHQETVAITQRPFNYHAHQSKIRSRSARKHSTQHSKRSPSTAAPSATAAVDSDETEQHLQNIRQFVQEKIGAQTGSAVEIKTTKVVNG